MIGLAVVGAGCAVALAGAVTIVWASVVEDGPPGWRTNLGTVLIFAGAVSALAGLIIAS